MQSAKRKLLRHGRGIQYVEHAEGHGDRLVEAVCKPALRDRLKETRCAVPLVENLDQGRIQIRQIPLALIR